MKHTVTIKRLFHRETNCLGIFFPKQPELIALVRRIPDVRFSATHTCWYIPDRPGALNAVFTVFKGVAWVDYAALKNPAPGTATLQAEGDEPNPVKESEAASQPIEESSALTVTTTPAQPVDMGAVHAAALEEMRRKLKFRNYSASTQKTYLEQFKLFLRFYPNSFPEELGEPEILHYLLYLIEKRRLSTSTQNQAINAIKFYYEKVLKQDRKVYDLERPMKEKRLPEVLSEQEVVAIFEATGNLKHRTMLMLLYASGLRRSELLNLRVGDVDMNRNMVLIRGGKGRKDRHSVMAQSLQPLLAEYIRSYQPRHWLFEGLHGEQYSATSLQAVLKAAVQKAGIRKHVRLHMLRHSFATHLLESGTSTRYIQVLLGHESPKTTEIYAQVTRFGLDKIRSPLDHIALNKQLPDEEKK